MCDFCGLKCKKKEDLMDCGEIRLLSRQFLWFDNSDGENPAGQIEIGHCPFCGEKLSTGGTELARN